MSFSTSAISLHLTDLNVVLPANIFTPLSQYISIFPIILVNMWMNTYLSFTLNIATPDSYFFFFFFLLVLVVGWGAVVGVILILLLLNLYKNHRILFSHIISTPVRNSNTFSGHDLILQTPNLMFLIMSYLCICITVSVLCLPPECPVQKSNVLISCTQICFQSLPKKKFQIFQIWHFWSQGNFKQ